jgi:nucleotide-binding universal stress UspA family protein
MKMEFRHILVPIDGSALSVQAVEAAARLAQRSGGSLTLLTAVEPPEAARAYVSDAALQEVRRGLSLAAGKLLEQAASRLTPLQLPVEKRIVEDSPVAAITAEANQGYDLIVMGSRGLGVQTAERTFLGSVAQRVLHRVNCPVLILPEHSDAR